MRRFCWEHGSRISICMCGERIQVQVRDIQAYASRGQYQTKNYVSLWATCANVAPSDFLSAEELKQVPEKDRDLPWMIAGKCICMN